MPFIFTKDAAADRVRWCESKLTKIRESLEEAGRERLDLSMYFEGLLGRGAAGKNERMDAAGGLFMEAEKSLRSWEAKFDGMKVELEAARRDLARFG